MASKSPFNDKEFLDFVANKKENKKPKSKAKLTKEDVAWKIVSRAVKNGQRFAEAEAKLIEAINFGKVDNTASALVFHGLATVKSSQKIATALLA